MLIGLGEVMGVKWIQVRRGSDPSWPRSLLLAVFFFLGVLAGSVCAGRASGSVGEELSGYLSAYLDAARQQSVSVSTVAALALAYLRGPLLVFLFGFTAAGTVLVPLTALAVGFFPAYAVSCLSAAFGGRGVWMALCFFGLRCVVTVPCFFLLASDAWRTSAQRLRVAPGSGRPTAEAAVWLRFAGVCVVLCLGVWCDLHLSPLLLRMLLERSF